MKSPRVFESVAAMLEPAALSDLLGVRVRSVQRQTFTVAHLSGNELCAISVQSDVGETRLILKEFHPAHDWVMRATHDTLTREAMLFAHGIYARMPTAIHVPVLAAARRGKSYVTCMRDVAAELLPSNQGLRENDARVLLEHLAAMHAQFWDDAALKNPALGLSSLHDFLTILSPARVRQELDTGRAHPVLEMAARGWEQFDAVAPKEVRRVIRTLHENPAQLTAKLEKMPQTLVHGDYKLGNLGVSPSPLDAPSRSLAERRSRLGASPHLSPGEGRSIVLDWQDATRGAGVLDLGYFLALNARWLPFEKAQAIEIYSNALAARGHALSTHEIEIGLLAGGALRLLWLMVLSQQNDLEWWYDLARQS